MSESRRWHARQRLWTVIVFVVVLLASLLTADQVSRISEQQSRRLLVEQTSEAALVLESSLTEIELSFPFIAGTMAVSPDPLQGFQQAATGLVSDIVLGVGAAQPVDGGYRTAALVGEGPAVGTAVDDELSALLARAATADGMVTAALTPEPRAEGDADHTRVAFAFAADGLPVLFLELEFTPAETVKIEEGSPFSDLAGALYVGSEADPSRLVLTTDDDLPMRSDLVHDTVKVGVDEWLFVTAAKRPLVGALAGQTQTGVLVGGLVLALLTAGLVEVLSQRRAYALRLVDERTADLESARQAAEDANRSKSEFLSRMSHELRTPLNAVLGFGQLLELEPLEADQQESVAQILKGGRHLLDLINEVLDISRIEAGELSLSPEAVHVEELLQEGVDLIKPLADQNGIQLVLDRSGVCDCYVFADRQRAKQVLLNLLSNAVKYNRARGTVALSCAQSSDTLLRVNVTDTGPGIPAEHIDRLFTAFDRLGAETSTVEGTGIGLALSQRLAGAMGGRLGVESTLGHGSTFYVELPRVEGPLHRYERLNGDSATTASAPSSDQRRVVLHIEDNLPNLKLVERIFATRPDVEVVAAMQGSLGLELAREHSPVLVLLDLHLPDMGGEQVLQRLRDDPATASIPVVIVSADATPGQVRRLLTAGATAYITKPIEVREILSVLDDALARS